LRGRLVISRRNRACRQPSKPWRPTPSSFTTVCSATFPRNPGSGASVPRLGHLAGIRRPVTCRRARSARGTLPSASSDGPEAFGSYRKRWRMADPVDIRALRARQIPKAPLFELGGALAEADRTRSRAKSAGIRIIAKTHPGIAGLPTVSVAAVAASSELRIGIPQRSEIEPRRSLTQRWGGRSSLAWTMSRAVILRSRWLLRRTQPLVVSRHSQNSGFTLSSSGVRAVTNCACECCSATITRTLPLNGILLSKSTSQST
jgi:hypothetical protein